MLVADAYPNYSICAIPYHISGEVPDAANLAHRSITELKATGMRLRLNTTATAIDPTAKRVTVRDPTGLLDQVGYDRLIVAHRRRPATPTDRRARRARRRRQSARAAHHGRHRRRHRHPHRTPADHGRHRRSRLHRPGNGRGADHPRPAGHRRRTTAAGPVHCGCRAGRRIADELRRHGVTVHTGTPIRAVRADDGQSMLLGDGGFRSGPGWCWCWLSPASDPTRLSPTRQASPSPARKPRSQSTGTCAPTSPTSGLRETAFSPVTGSSARHICRWAPPPTSRAG